MCIASGGLSGPDQIKFREMCHLLQSVFHFEFHQKLEVLKDSYAPLNPDRDTRKVGIYTTGEEGDFVGSLNELLNKANYERLSEEDIQQALNEASLFKLKLHVDFDAFEELLIYSRGESFRTEEIKSFYGLRRKKVEFANFDRVVVYIKLKSDVTTRRHEEKPGATMLKMFQNVPRADIEMLFPNTRLGMRTIDKMMIGIPALLGGGAVLTTKIGTSMLLLGALLGFWLGVSSEPVELDRSTLLALVAGMAGLGSYIWKQFVNFKNRKLTFMQTLTESLYFKSLDNNAGVFYRLIDDAEEEECKEAFLAYYFLLTNPDLSTVEELDKLVEDWFSTRWESEVDFEEQDALEKLVNVGLVHRVGDSLSAISIDDACIQLDKRWDEYFSYHPG